MNEQMKVAERELVNWLSDEQELGKAPMKIECKKEFDLYGLHYYVFRFKKRLLHPWLLGVCGGFEGESLDHCGHVFSNMEEYVEQSAVEKAIELVEQMRKYWMEQASKQEIQNKFKENLKYISQTEIEVKGIEKQFVRTESRYYLNVGEIDCPTGRIVVADPLCYLAAGKFCPELVLSVKPGRYPVEVSICRYPITGIRMCTARLKLKDTAAVKYVNADSTRETAAATSEDGVMNGFPVDAGMMSFCDAQIAEEYRTFLDNWEKQNPQKNYYDDYFANFFSESYRKLPAYQREDGDFIEWSNPETENKMVMIASGFGDGFYQSFWGYDAEGEICELIVPMVNPDLFEE